MNEVNWGGTVSLQGSIQALNELVSAERSRRRLAEQNAANARRELAEMKSRVQQFAHGILRDRHNYLKHGARQGLTMGLESLAHDLIRISQ